MSGATGAVTGGIIGGISGGINAVSNHTDFFTGKATFDISNGVGAHNIPKGIGNKVGVKYVGRFEKIAVYESSSLGSGSGS